ncbi:MAG: M1 family metallopeptidase [Clostridiales bacterium]|nr:M1 family metallopeptidase [Clostridiales bacterium]
MKKLLTALIFILFFASCGNRNGQIEDEAIIEPEINGGYENIVEPEPERPAPEIPRYNEYRVSLEINPEERTVHGISEITFTNRNDVPLETIVLRAYLNAFAEDTDAPVFSELEWRAFPNGRDYGFLDIQYAFVDNEPVEIETDETVITINLSAPLEPNSTVQLLLQYDALIPLIAHNTGGNENALWFGMFLPVLSVFDEEGENGWHTEPYYRAGNPFLLETANYRVDVTTPARYVVVGTGLRTEEVIGDTDTKITHFTAHQARDFAFAVSPYFQHAYTSTESSIDIHLYYYTDPLAVDDVLTSARRSIEFFEEHVGIYPLGKVTIVETEQMQDSVSFSQIVFMDSWYLTRGGRNRGLAHGLGNQWFASVVGTNRISEPWLTNGLTRFVQAGITNETPEELFVHMERDYVSISASGNLILARGLDTSSTWSHYAHTHGRKAMLMIYALHQLMGAELFWEFIAEYYQTYSFNIATTNDFIELAETFYGDSLTDFFGEWFNNGTVPPMP